MKILLISSNLADSPYPTYPLGCSMVAAALSRAGHTVRQFDLLEQNGSLEAVEREIRDIRPDLIGISIRNVDNVNLVNEKVYIDVVRDVVLRVREVSEAPIVLGGAGFSLIPEAILEATGADYGIVGEGEALMAEFAGNAERGIFPTARLLGPQARLTGAEIPSAGYDKHLLDYYMGKGGVIPVQTKRGCAHSCIYCTYPLLEGHGIRPRDPREVVEDIKRLSAGHGVKYIFFTDSVFNDDQGIYLALLEEMRRSGVKTPWTAFFKPQGLTDEIVKLMKSTGLSSVEVGADAPTDSTLSRLGKPFRFRDVVECNDLFVKHGVAVAHFFMFGCPGETPETVAEGINNLKSLKNCVKFISMGLRILPQTPLANLAVREGLISADDNLLKSVYYVSPATGREWLKETLAEAFSGIRDCVFPPDALDNAVKTLLKLGYAGSLWNLLLPKTGTRRIKSGDKELVG